MKSHYDYIVIGAGSGALSLIEGLKAEKKDFLIVSKDIGGESTNAGCVPSKSLLKFADEYYQKGIKDRAEAAKVLKRVRQKVKEVLEQDTGTIGSSKFIEGEAKFVDKNKISVLYNGKTRIYSFNKCIISTGSSPRTLDIEGLDKSKILTNKNVFQLKEIPKNLTIIGGGSVATELATAFAKLGTNVTMLVRSRIMSELPEDFALKIKLKLIDLCVEIKENTELELISKNLAYLSSGEKTRVSDYYLFAVGRRPNTNLDLEKAGIIYNDQGIKVNSRLETSNPKVYAIGDCIDSFKFTHYASGQARKFLVEDMSALSMQKMGALPMVLFTDPEVATVGQVCEDKLIQKIDIDFTNSDKAIIDDTKNLNAAVFVHMITGEVKGAIVMGTFAEHIINFFTLAINEKYSLFKLNSFIAPYPTYFFEINKLYFKFLNKYKKDFWRNLPIWLMQNWLSIFAWILLVFAIIYFLSSWNEISFIFKYFLNNL